MSTVAAGGPDAPQGEDSSPGASALPVTVVVPAHERQQHVAEAVHSALRQRPHPPAEVLVVDDGSRDETARVAREAGARVLRLQVNRGRGGARNAGLAAATQPWIALLDSDDVWRPDHLARLWQHRHGHVLVAASALSSRRTRVFGNPGRAPLEITSPSQLFWPENPIVTSSVLVRAEVLRGVGGFSERDLAQDLDTWIPLLATGSALVLPDVSLAYREHDGQASADRTGVHTAVRAILASHAHRAWHTQELVGRLHALQDAELLAAAWRRGQWRSAAELVARLARRPGSAASLLEAGLWRYRAHTRERAGVRR